jgi:5-methylcytosine-specific restriction endonuclease McrA
MMACEFQPKAGKCWCGKKLVGRQRKYCSRNHSKEVTDNHRWTNAKRKLKSVNAFYQCQICEEFFKNVDIDVDHLIPCKGQHGVWGCHHHQDNLRILCKPCHKAVTRQQHANGDFK